MTIKNRQITLAERPKGMPDEQTFQFKTEEINEIQQDEVYFAPYMFPSIHICVEEW